MNTILYILNYNNIKYRYSYDEENSYIDLDRNYLYYIVFKKPTNNIYVIHDDFLFDFFKDWALNCNDKVI